MPKYEEAPFGSYGRAGTANDAYGHDVDGMKGHLVAGAGEFVGTVMFLWFAFAGHLMAVSQIDEFALNDGISSETVIYVALAYGFSFLVVAWAWYRISGGLFNPAITIGMVIGGTVSVLRAVFLIIAQILGAIVAAALVECMFPGPIEAVITTLGPNTSIARGVFIEMFLTFLLVFVSLMLAGEKTNRLIIAPIGIGLALFVIHIAGFFYTSASVNPARSFGPSVVGPSFPGHHWIYWVGPLLGAVIAGGYFRAVKFLYSDRMHSDHNGVTRSDVPPV